MITKYKKILFISLSSLIVLVAVPFVRAQVPMSITTFPAVQDINITPGERTRVQIQFKNNNNSPVSGLLKVADYTINDKEGTPVLIEDTDIKPKFGAASWISLLYDRATIPENDFITLDVFIDPPADIGTCGHYAVVYFQPSEGSLGSASSDRDSATSVVTKIGALLNLTTDTKKCEEKASIANFTYPTFLEYGPITVSYDVSNSGDVHITPKGFASITNALGQLTDQKVLEDKRIFPETLKSYKDTFGKKWMFGPYKVAVKATYGLNDDKIVTKSAIVWVIPWKVLLIVLLAIILLILLFRKTLISQLLKGKRLEAELQEERERLHKLQEELKKKE